jgi:S1-C subfamily serine protease
MGMVGASGQSSLGLKLEGLVISDMVLGGPAHASGLLVGDELVQADDVQLIEIEQAFKTLKGSDMPGTIV